MILIVDDGRVALLDTGGGCVTYLAESREQFCQLIDKPENAENWLFISLVDRLVEAGVRLGHHQCYGFRLPPMLGGEYSVENIRVCNIRVHHTLMGQLSHKLRNSPDGTPIAGFVVKAMAGGHDVPPRSLPATESDKK